MSSEQKQDPIDLNRAAREGFTGAMGVELLTATKNEVRVRMTVGPEHLQPYGIVHGGVFCGIVETACSIGAGFNATEGQVVVGVENQTSFLRSVREGTVTGRATPIHIGRRSQLWEAEIRDEQNRLVATGRLRLLSVEAAR